MTESICPQTMQSLPQPTDGQHDCGTLDTDLPNFVEGATQNTPLAPSVEKAYYRKCIELKRRLNEVEAANDEAKTRRVRLDRAIMKMRLERAFLLDELRKRMEHDMVDSEGSGDDGVTTVRYETQDEHTSAEGDSLIALATRGSTSSR